MTLSKIKIDYLKRHIGFEKSELTHKRQIELESMPISTEFAFAALGRKSLDEWNKYGFGLFKDFNFIKEVNAYLKTLEEEDEAAFIEREQPKTTAFFNTFGITKTMDVMTLASYPKKTWEWIDDNTIRSKLTNTAFNIVGGKETYEKLIRGELDVKAPDVWVYWANGMYNNKYAPKKPMPIASIEWHRMTKFKFINEVKEGIPKLYNAWSSSNLIPKDDTNRTSDDWDLD